MRDERTRRRASATVALIGNVSWLAGYRHPRHLLPEVAAANPVLMSTEPPCCEVGP
jgi:hypothetical protein